MPATNRGFIRSHGRDHVTHGQLTATLDQINDERTTLRHRLAQPTTPGIAKRRASPARLSQFDHLAHHATKNLANTTSLDQHRVYQLLASP